MHQSSMDRMTYFRDKYLGEKAHHDLIIVDIGSQDVNGTYKPLFASPRWKYIGVDRSAGNNVDLILEDPYRFREIESNSVDVIVSGQTFEHVEFFWITMLEIARVLKSGALCCVIVPSSGPQHRFPVDCWRFYPDGLRALALYAGLTVMEVFVGDQSRQYTDSSQDWNDAIMVCSKPHRVGVDWLRYTMGIGAQRWAFRVARALNGEK